MTALIAAAVFRLVGPAITNYADIGIALVTLALVAKTKISPILIILGAGVAGVVLYGYIL